MMDLHVNLAASAKLNPAGFTTVLLSDDPWKPLDYKANQTVGSVADKFSNDLHPLRVKLAPKIKEEKKSKVTKPGFEVTC
jgi:hypothetical protein